MLTSRVFIVREETGKVTTRGAALGWAPDALARILDRAPPVVEESFRGHTRLTGRWEHGELHDHLGGMEGHVIITYYEAPQEIVWRRGAERLAGTTRSGTITIIPEGHEGRWDIAGPIGVSHVFLPHARLAASAEQLIGSKPVELLARVGFDDPAAARIMELLGREAAVADASSRLLSSRRRTCWSRSWCAGTAASARSRRRHCGEGLRNGRSAR